jgi:hypothetical protein
MSVSCECCVLSGRGICCGLITGTEISPTECGVSEYDLETSIERGLRPASAVETRRNFTARGIYDRKLENGICIHVTVRRYRFLFNNQPDALIIQNLFCHKTLYMFLATSLPIIKSFLLYIRHW